MTPTHLVVGNDGGGAVSTNDRRQVDGAGLPDRAVLSRRDDEAHPVSRLRLAAGQQHALHPLQLERGAFSGATAAAVAVVAARGRGTAAHHPYSAPTSRSAAWRVVPGGRR